MLLVDIGNSALKWRHTDDEGNVRRGRCAHGSTAWQTRLSVDWQTLETPNVVTAGNVAGARVESVIGEVAKALWGIEPHWVRTQAFAFDVTNSYAVPTNLGVDRWLTLVAAHRGYPGSAIIIDAGSAVTVDAIDTDGQHLGGAIVPGVGLMQRSLSDNTHGIPPSEADVAENLNSLLLSQDTPPAVARGCLYASAAFIDRATAQLREQLGGQVHLLLLGGDAERLQPLLRQEYQIVHDLIFDGLKCYAEQALAQ